MCSWFPVVIHVSRNLKICRYQVKALFSRLSPSCSQLIKMYTTVERGAPNSESYRIYFRNEAGPISPLHDIPMCADREKNIFNMVVEVPRWTNAKMEINLKETLNPIKQDIKKGKLRYVANCFPHHGYIWNYGAIPQTWENPEVLDESTNCKGDNDPIDILEIGYRVAKRGEVLQVKPLGALALIDEGETDWKIIAIDVNDPLADQLNDVEDVEKKLPGLLKASVEWFKIYKIPDGKPENQFAFNGEAKGRQFSLNIIEEVHHHWQSLIKNETKAPEISCANVSIADSPFKISNEEAEEALSKAAPLKDPEPVDPIGFHDVWLMAALYCFRELVRALQCRIKEHKRATEKKQFCLSAIAEHAWSEPGHEINFEGTKLLVKENRYIPRIIQEAVEIIKNPNNFNREDGYTLSSTWKRTLRPLGQSEHAHGKANQSGQDALYIADPKATKITST